jgi:hypothetical protein
LVLGGSVLLWIDGWVGEYRVPCNVCKFVVTTTTTTIIIIIVILLMNPTVVIAITIVTSILHIVVSRVW